ncbi:single-stranded-DNA-specific exonuclease RecJ [Neptuniibacter sp. QD37_11]|uniref:single-stranded-DNA-specific exonuclease RecJ n=1 Tax=Neptuniibacter sp. QD37_11 TaxID=3398209 RepID=UPI0039F5A97A
MQLKIRPIKEKKTKSHSDIVHNNPLLNQVYLRRGIESPSDLEYPISKLPKPDTLKDIDKAVDVLSRHIMADSSVLIIGDFDCDGATSTSTGKKGLELCGAKNVDYILPDRSIHGYGLTPAIVELAAEYKPDLIITVDCGISSFQGAKAVEEMLPSCELIITDHHLPDESGKVPPEASAIINPSQPGDTSGLNGLAGVGVMFYTIIALRAHMEKKGYFDQLNIDKPSLSSLIPYVALGTVADMVPMKYHYNRTIVSHGLRLINSADTLDDKGNPVFSLAPGLRALIEVSGKTIGQVDEFTFGFGLGPRINAAGRLEDATKAVQMLICDDYHHAKALAEDLDATNIERKQLQAEMQGEARGIVEQINLDNENDQCAYVLYNPDWHEGVVGLVSSYIMKEMNAAVISFTATAELKEAQRQLARAETEPERKQIESLMQDMLIKGSSRSIPGCHLKHALDGMFKKNQDMLPKFGGHAAAAGLSIPLKYLDQFTREFSRVIEKEFTADMKAGLMRVDVMNPDEGLITIDNAIEISQAGPWGMEFEAPVFGGEFEIVNFIPLGAEKNHAKLFLRPIGGAETFEAVWWRCRDEVYGFPFKKNLEAVFKIEVNEFRGARKVQLNIEYAQDPEWIKEKLAEIETGVEVKDDLGYTPVTPQDPNYDQQTQTQNKKQVVEVISEECSLF